MDRRLGTRESWNKIATALIIGLTVLPASREQLFFLCWRGSPLKQEEGGFARCVVCCMYDNRLVENRGIVLKSSRRRTNRTKIVGFMREDVVSWVANARLALVKGWARFRRGASPRVFVCIYVPPIHLFACCCCGDACRRLSGMLELQIVSKWIIGWPSILSK